MILYYVKHRQAGSFSQFYRSIYGHILYFWSIPNVYTKLDALATLFLNTFLLCKLSTHTDDVYYKVCLIFDTKAIYNMSHSCGQWNLKACILLKFVIKLDRHYPKQCNNILTISTLNAVLRVISSISLLRLYKEIISA